MSLLSRRDLLKVGVAAGLSPLAQLARADQNQGGFSFAYFSDTHVRLKGNIDENRAMLAEIKAFQPAFAINGGDVTDYGWAGEFDNYQALIKEFGVKVYDTAGNHDVRWSPQGVKIFKERLGEPFGCFQHQGVHFFVLDSTVPLSHWGHYEATQLKWLETRLRGIGKQEPVFVTTHHWVGRDAVMIDNEELLRRILEPYNVKLIFNGHGHSDLLWNWDGMVNTMNKGLYQGSWQRVDVDFEKEEVRLYRRTTQKPARTLISTVPLRHSADRRPIWAGLCTFVHHEVQRSNERVAQLAAVDDHVDHSVFEKEFASLKSFRQLLTDSLFDHTRPGKTDQRLWFGHDNVTEHRKTGRDATGRWIGENRNERQACCVEH